MEDLEQEPSVVSVLWLSLVLHLLCPSLTARQKRFCCNVFFLAEKLLLLTSLSGLLSYLGELRWSLFSALTTSQQHK